MDSVAVVHFIKGLLLPPAIFFIGLCIAAVLIPRFYRTGMALLGVLIVFFYVLTTPFTALRLISLIESQTKALSPESIKDLNGPGAIVVLSAGRNIDADEYGEDTVDATTLERIRYAAKIKRIKDLPLIVSGGKLVRWAKPMALLMKRSLQEDYRVSVEYTEPNSRTTWENAFKTRDILANLGVDHIILVTHASHMPRSLQAFKAAGIKVTPAPTSFLSHNVSYGLEAFIPSLKGTNAGTLYCYELLGSWWYAIKSWFVKTPEAIGQTPPPPDPGPRTDPSLQTPTVKTD